MKAGIVISRVRQHVSVRSVSLAGVHRDEEASL